MHRFVLAVPLLVACNGDNPYNYQGYPMSDFFPFDGDRSWRFVTDEAGRTTDLVATLSTEIGTGADDERLRTVSYALECIDGETCSDAGPHHISSIQWSADQTFGVRIHAMTGADGDETFDPPIAVSADMGKPTDVWETETGGNTFVSTFESIGDCPIQMDVDWDECVKLVLTDADGGASHPLHGEIWAVTSYNLIAMQLEGDDSRWEASSVDFDPIED